jgi:hypothetical protein
MGDLLLSGRNSVGRWEGDRSRPPARKLRRWVEIVAERTTYEPDSVVQFLGLPPVIELDERRRMDRRKPPQSPMWISLIAA